MKTSASLNRRYSTVRPAAVRRSSARLFLFRVSNRKPGLSGFLAFGTARRRYGSPIPGGSILMTSAPKSDITVAAAGPAIKLAQSMILSPSKIRSVTNESSSCVLATNHRGTEHAANHHKTASRRKPGPILQQLAAGGVGPGFRRDAGVAFPLVLRRSADAISVLSVSLW